jgi:ornithine cyclodeaminase/alanine dehydrogenase-like protein (mu-crystallin family)
VSDLRPLILGDDDVARLADMGTAIAAVERAFHARATGNFVAPPRHAVEFPGFGSLIFTTGGMTGGPALAGFRVRNDFDKNDTINDQIVAVWDMKTARLEGLVLSDEVGAIRTGAIGGVAIKFMARPDAAIAAVIGAGPQARTQIEAAARVRQLREIRVFSRSADKRDAFAEATAARTGVACLAASSAEAAVGGADIVILATTSKTPVIEASWLKAGAHINTLGPRSKSGAEIGADVAGRASLIATDSPDQIAALGSAYFLADTPAMDRMVDLADMVAGRTARRPPHDAISLFCSIGLAGTEILVAAALLAAARAQG